MWLGAWSFVLIWPEKLVKRVINSRNYSNTSSFDKFGAAALVPAEKGLVPIPLILRFLGPNPTIFGG